MVANLRVESIIKERKNNLCATMQDIGIKYGVSRERVRQILCRAGLPTKKWVQMYQCNQCGKEMRRKGVFCSRQCEHQYHSVTLVCRNCKKEFARRASLTRWSLRYGRKEDKDWFCSNKCKGEYHHTTLVCDYCEKTFQRPNSQIRHWIHHFCSAKCMTDYYRLHPKCFRRKKK